MLGLWSIWKREVRYYFSQPAAYVMIAVFLIIADLAFLFIFNYYTTQSASMGKFSASLPYDFTPNWIIKAVFDFLGTVILIMLPFVTMRLVAEEKRQRTDELLYTSPIRIADVIGGKFLAALTLLSAMLILTVYLPLLVSKYGELNWTQVFTGYIGLFLMGAGFIAIGLFISSMTESQVVAGLVTFGILLGLWLISGMGEIVGRLLDVIAPSLSMGIEGGLKYLSLNDHLNPFLDGILDTRDLIFYASAVLLGLFLSHRVIESSRWR
jgi:ABC-2 type transport system permease protein